MIAKGYFRRTTFLFKYKDKDWQYFWVLRFSQRDFIKIRIAAETLFADWDPNKPDELGDPVRDLANRIIPVLGYNPKLII